MQSGSFCCKHSDVYYFVVYKSCRTPVNPWTVACQASLSIGFPRQEYWSGLPFLHPGDLSHPGFESISSALAGGSFTTEPPEKVKETQGYINKGYLSHIILSD